MTYDRQTGAPAERQVTQAERDSARQAVMIGLQIPGAYPLFMGLATLTFLVVSRLQPRPPLAPQLPVWDRLILLGAAFMGGSLGGKLPFVLVSQQAWSWQAWFMDGKTITTGLIGAYLMVELAKWWLGIRVKTGDRFALPLACALAVGRWGCFFNGCCFGTPTGLPWGVWFPHADAVCHPTQVYESLFHATMAVVLVVAIRRQWWPSHRLQVYLLAYCLYRFVTEWIRPEPIVGAGLTFYQWAVLLFGVGLVIQWLAELGRQRRERVPQEVVWEGELVAESDG